MLLKTTEEVSVFIKTIEPFVLAGEAKFALARGGRQAAPDLPNNINDGVTLNLSLLKAIEVKYGWRRCWPQVRRGVLCIIN